MLPSFGGGDPKVEGLKAAADAAKQIITLNVAMIGLTITFMEKVVEIDAHGVRHISWQMGWGWFFYLFSLAGGLATLLGVSGTMTTLDRHAMGLPLDPRLDDEFDVYSPTVRAPMAVMVIALVVALILTVFAAVDGASKSAATLPPVGAGAGPCQCLQPAAQAPVRSGRAAR